MFAAEVQHHGSLFTLFLHSPLTALCYICNVGDVPIHHWERCQSYVDHFITEASRLVTRCRIDEIDQGYIGKIFIQFERCSLYVNIYFISRNEMKSCLKNKSDETV